jgi:hypothetical protein
VLEIYKMAYGWGVGEVAVAGRAHAEETSP